MNDPRDSAPGMPVFLLLALFLAWQLPGVLGREPWKSDEAYTMGLVYHVVETGDYVVPELGGEPFMQKPTLFFVAAALLGELLAPVAPLHVGARMATLLFNLLTMIFVGLASRELNGRGRGWPAAVLFLACIGPLHMAHFLLTDLALLAGVSLSLWGMAVGLRRAWAGGLLCGTGAGLAFMSKGLLGAGLPGVAVLLLPILDRAWRGRNWLAFTAGCVLAALPWASIWPAVLLLRSPQLFSEWFVDNNFGRFHPEFAQWLMGRLEAFAHAAGLLPADAHLVFHDLRGPKSPRGYMFLLLPWYAFPASGFAAWAIWRERREGAGGSSFRVPLIFLGGGLLIFTVSRDGREIYALPLVAPLLLTAARRLDELGAVVVRRLNAVAFWGFSILAFAAWLAWGAMMAGAPAPVAAWISARLPGFEPSVEWACLAGATLLSLAWVALILRHRAEPRHVALHLAAGVALAYGLGMTLFLPAAEWQMSYRRQFAPLRSVLPPGGEVVLSRGLGEPQRAMLHYYAGLKTLRLEKKANRRTPAKWVLTQNDFPADRHHPGAGWTRVWEARHEDEWFQLFRKVEP